MVRILRFLIPIFLAIIVFAGFLFFISKKDKPKGALQVTSTPKEALVYLNNKLIGKTPLCLCNPQDRITIGEYSIRLVPQDSSLLPYEDKITINPEVLSVVDRIFSDVGKSSGSLINLSKNLNSSKAQLFVTSLPYDADVSLDGVSVGKTPLSLDTITDSDHDLIVGKVGYKNKEIKIHGVLGYKLNAIITLSTDDLTAQNASPSAQIVISVTPPPASITGTTNPQVLILDTPTGFLRVRSSASLSGDEIAQVHPGEKYPFIADSSNSEWIQIKLTDGKLGWVSGTYAKKQ